jgi:hypothetical protein
MPRFTVMAWFAGAVAATAFAGDAKLIEVPLPPEEPVPGTEEPVTPEVVVPVESADAGKYRPRREVRQIAGEAPASLAGTWSVVQLTELGETEDYRIKMEREGKALDEDCIVIATWFDFGGGGGGLPAEVTVTQVQQCEKGGLGAFSSETSMTSAVTWTPGQLLSLELPEVRVDEQLIRLRIADEPGRTPSNWVGPELRVERPSVKYTVLAEYPPRKKDGDRPTALHLTGTNGAVWHLEPLQAVQ